MFKVENGDVKRYNPRSHAQYCYIKDIILLVRVECFPSEENRVVSGIIRMPSGKYSVTGSSRLAA